MRNSMAGLLAVALFGFAGGALFAAGTPETEERTVYTMSEREQLIEAARAEGEVVVYATSSRIGPAGENFEAEYGIPVRGTKMGDPEQRERVMRESDAGNVQVDVILYEDGPTLFNELIPQGYVEPYTPETMRALIPDEYLDPVNFRLQPRVFGYNPEVYGDTSPVTNVWELTEEEWRGRFFLRDPMETPATLSFFATIVESPEMMAEAYRSHYGREIELREADAGWEFIRRLFENNPVVTGSDDDVGEAVGARGQENPPIGLYTYTKHRDIEDKNLSLAVALDMEPFVGYALDNWALVVANGPNPNAARLFVEYVLQEGGVGPWLGDIGAFSPNPDLPVHPDDDLGSWSAWMEVLMPVDYEAGWRHRETLQDYWLLYAER
ncbi:MAG: ABC transporter substrate-binding protein [Spirochaetota bacterium]